MLPPTTPSFNHFTKSTVEDTSLEMNGIQTLDNSRDATPLSNTSQIPSPKARVGRLQIIFFIMLCVASLYMANQILSIACHALPSIILAFLNWLGFETMYRLFMMILNFHGIAVLSSFFVDTINRMIATQWLNHWTFPTNDGFELEGVTIRDALQVLGITLLILGGTFVLMYIYDHVEPLFVFSSDWTHEMPYTQPFDLGIGAFDDESREEAQDSILFSPTRDRSTSEVQLFNLEDGLVRRRVKFAGESVSSPDNGKVRKTNPATPMYVDFAGAGYSDIIARNLKRAQQGSGVKAPNSRESPQLRSVSDTAGHEDFQSGRSTPSPESRMPQATLVGTELDKIFQKPLPRSATMTEGIHKSLTDSKDNDAAAIGFCTNVKGSQESGCQEDMSGEADRVKAELRELRSKIALSPKTAAALRILDDEIDAFDKLQEQRQLERLREEADLEIRIKKCHENRELLRQASFNAANTSTSEREKKDE